MSAAVLQYPVVQWNLPGMRPLQVSLISMVLITSLAGILSNPLLSLANASVSNTPLLQSFIKASTVSVSITDVDSHL